MLILVGIKLILTILIFRGIKIKLILTILIFEATELILIILVKTHTK